MPNMSSEKVLSKPYLAKKCHVTISLKFSTYFNLEPPAAAVIKKIFLLNCVLS